MIAQIITENGTKKIKPLTADAGAGNPVGTIIPMYKKSSPSGYLYCDGSTFDQTKYPLLYAYLGSNVLPDYREFALVGAEQNTTSQNIATHDTYTEGQEKDDQLQDHGHSVLIDGQGTTTSQVGLHYTGNNNNNWYASFVGNPINCRAGSVTRGKRKAVFFYIKATSGLSENAQDNVLAQFKEYSRNQNILADPETITISTNSSLPTIMQYDGFIVEQLATPNTNEYVSYSINGNISIMMKSSGMGNATSNMTVPYRKGDSIYIVQTGNHGATARVMQYKLRDYTGR